MVLETKNSPRGGKKMSYEKLLDFKDFPTGETWRLKAPGTEI